MTAARPGVPGIWRRLACFLYEGVLLFGVVMAAGLLYGILTDQRHALVGTRGLQVWLLVVLGGYFVGFWSWQGQTLAMRTWRITLVDVHGRRPSLARAAGRFLLCWLWFIPALAAVWIAGLRGAGAVTGVVTVGVIAYAALARFHPSRQFLHDLLCGTRLVHWEPQTVGQNSGG